MSVVERYHFTVLDRFSLCVHFVAWALVALISPRGALEAMLASAEEARRQEQLADICAPFENY